MAATFPPPAPGYWELDRSHTTGGATPIVSTLTSESADAAFRRLFAEFGIPAETLSMKYVNGFCYTRLRPLMSADRPPRRSPPVFVTKLITRLHPEFRRRATAAARTLSSRPWRRVVEQWRTEIRPGLERRNLALQDVDTAAMDDIALSRHLAELLAHARLTFEEHFYLHGFDLGPLGMLILAGRGWGLPPSEVVGALVGASPSTSAPAEALIRVREGIEAAGLEPTSLAEVRAASPVLAAELDGYLRHRGAVLYSGYDIDTPTLCESPGVVLSAILHGQRQLGGRPDPEAVAAQLRERVPPDDRARFDELLGDARAAMDMRDDNGPLTVEWPTGLLRLAMLEASRRLVAAGRLTEVDHVFELEASELVTMTRGGQGPEPAVVAARAVRRQACKALDPPATLGREEAEPPIEVLPAPLATMVSVVTAVLAELGMSGRHASVAGDDLGLAGCGIGEKAVTGVARTAATAEEAIAALEPGEILVTRTTSPAYNMVLNLVGGLVTAEGGVMSHAAVLSRELGIPAVVGARGAMAAIADGDLVVVDPRSGTVRVLERSSTS